MGIFETFEAVLKDPRWLYLGAFIVLFASATMTLPITPRPTEMTIGFYNVVTSAQPGNIFMGAVIAAWPIWAEQVEMNLPSTYQYLYNKGVNIIFLPSSATFNFELIMIAQWLGFPTNIPLNKVTGYGTRFVVMDPNWALSPYVTSVNFRGVGSYDIFGTSFDSLPLLKNIKDGTQIYGYIGSALGGDWCVAYGRTNTKCIAVGCAGAITVAGTYYATGLYKGVLLGAKGGMEMDYLLGFTSGTRAYRAGTAFAAVALYSLLCPLIFNLVNGYSMMTRKRPLSMRKEEAGQGGTEKL